MKLVVSSSSVATGVAAGCGGAFMRSMLSLSRRRSRLRLAAMNRYRWRVCLDPVGRTGGGGGRMRPVARLRGLVVGLVWCLAGRCGTGGRGGQGLGTPGMCRPGRPSGAIVLSLPHSQVRSRISRARSSWRFRLASGLQCSSMIESYLWEKRA